MMHDKQHEKENGADMKVNLHAPGSGRTTTHESLAGAFGIPEFMPPNRRRDFHSKPACARQRTHHRPMKVRRAHLEYLIRIASGDGTFTVNLHAPGCGRATNYESLAGAFGIPDFKSPPAMGLSQ